MSEQKPRGFRGGRILVLVAVAVGGGVLAGRLATSFFVELLWFDSVGYSRSFWVRTLWQWGVRLLVAGVTALLVFLNLRVVATTLGGIQIKRRFGNIEIAEQLPASYVLLGIAATGALLGLWFGASIPAGTGLQLLALLRAPSWGLADPVLGRDLSFYIFGLPVLEAGLTVGLVLVFLLFALAVAGYAATGAVQWSGQRVLLTEVPRRHLTILGAAFLLLLAARFWVGRYGLLLDGNSAVQGIFGYADAEARIPGYEALAVLCALAAATVVWAGLRSRMAPLVGALATVVAGLLVLGYLYPSLVQRFRVEPNELAREARFIEHNIAFTRLAYGLHLMERRRVELGNDDGGVDAEDALRQLSGLTVWTPSTLLATFKELEARFRYYDFADVTVDRYAGPEGPVPVAVAVREIDPSGIEDPNWQNLHLRERFVVGMGAVAAAANLSSGDGRPVMFLSGIPPEFSRAGEVPAGLRLLRPSVFFQSRPQLYAVVNPGDSAFLAPDGAPGAAGVDFPAGIRLRGRVRTAALAWHFGDANLLFASEVTPESRFVFRRQVTARARAVAPFLEYPNAPQPVIHEGRIVWMLDGYTVTASFPLAAARELAPRRRVRYVRNSVKATVDAVTGDLRFYVVDPEDRVLLAYRQAFPDLLRPLDEMPDALRRHIRYPRELLDLQATLLTQYHQETAPVFHGQQDVWALTQQMAYGTTTVPYRPEYGIYRLPGELQPEFLLTTLLVPAGRQNLTAVLVARSESERYGELLLIDVPVEAQVPGPRQVEALIEQDPAISQQFSLWRRGGSQVWSGHLHLVAVDGRPIYMEPIFLAAEEGAIPELRRFIVSDGRNVVMQATLDAAVQALPRARGAGAQMEPPPPPFGLPGGEWPEEALGLLDEAERRLRAGDWTGFGRALAELRSLLERLAVGDPPVP